jgi:hypothetical protein
MDMMQGAVTMRTMIMNKPILKNLRTLTIDSAHVRADGAAKRVGGLRHIGVIGKGSL